MVNGVHGHGCSAMPWPCCTATVQAQLMAGAPAKIRLISWGTMSPISDIKLIRTDTTLDLSQKAEKGMILQSPRDDGVVATSTAGQKTRLWAPCFAATLIHSICKL